MNFDLLLNNIRKHISLTTEETIFFTSLLQPKSLAKGDFLLREGTICKYDSFVVKGCLKTYYLHENGTEQIIDFLIEEWWANDLYSLFTQTASKSNIKAIEDTQLLQVSAVDLEILYQKIPKFERFFRLLFQKAYIAQREQINAGLSVSAEERYQLFVQKKPYAESRFTQKDIAAYLGITPQFLSVLKKKLHPLR
jgi:CRP-like cAMP-binding protein